MNRLLFLFALAASLPVSAQGLPDIDGGDAILLATERGNPGETLGVPITAGNNGTAPAPDFPAAVYLSRYPMPNADAIFLDRVMIPGIAPQQNGGGGTTVTLPDVPRGGYYIVVALDDPDTVVESNETNNVNLGEFTIRPVLDGPDLLVSTGRLEDSQAAPGDRVSVEFVVANRGLSAIGDFAVGYYLSTDFRWSPDDLFLERETLGGLDADETEDESDQVTIPASTPPGNYQFIIVLDDENTVAERIEHNNTFLFQLVVTGTVAGEEPATDTRFRLRANPNPVSRSVALSYTLPEVGVARLTVYDVLGRAVAVVGDSAHGVGSHNATLDVSALPPGVYVARLETDDGTTSATFTVAR